MSNTDANMLVLVVETLKLENKTLRRALERCQSTLFGYAEAKSVERSSRWMHAGQREPVGSSGRLENVLPQPGQNRRISAKITVVRRVFPANLTAPHFWMGINGLKNPISSVVGRP